MDGLRWTLLIIAVLIIAGIYWWGRRARRAQALQDEPQQGLEWRDPPDDILMAEEFERLSGMISAERDERPARAAQRHDAPASDTPVTTRAEAPAARDAVPPAPQAPPPAPAEPRRAAPARPDPEESLILVLHVMAREGMLEGERLAEALEAAGLGYGEMDIYHRLDAHGTAVFSAASMIKPGTLKPGELAALRTPGVALFLQAPGPADPKQAFEDMLEAARTVAQAVGAELRDETRSVLTPQTIAHLRERVEAFDFRRRLGARAR